MEREENLVSIVSPAYNAGRVVCEMIDSVVKQTWTNWELLIVDDCSSDNTQSLVTEYAQKDERVRLISATKNGGPASARNLAIQSARGRWLAFLDSDDLWREDKLEKSIECALEYDAGLVYTAYQRISANGDRVGDTINVPNTMSYNQLLGHTAIVTSTVLIDRDVYPTVYMEQTYYDDFACWLEILRAGVRARGLGLPLTLYRMTPNSVSRNKLNSAFQVWKAYRNVQHLSLIKSVSSFTRYAFNAAIKYRKF